MYEIEITPEGLRQLERLPEKIASAALELVFGPLSEAPRRVGKPLVGELQGLWSARRGDYRVVYEIDDGRRAVLIHRVQHRGTAYRPR